jgi:mannose-6-phosphate isomerase-like protein (cupin superfamily)
MSDEIPGKAESFWIDSTPETNFSKLENGLKVDKVVNMREGKGTVEIRRFIEGEEFHGKGRLFGKITLKPGVSIGLHQHVGDCETFYVLNGDGLYNDNGSLIDVSAGDILYVDNMGSHSIENKGDSDLELLALILFV